MPSIRLSATSLLLTATLVITAACGDKKNSAASPPTPAADTGKSVSNTSQLAGTWFRATDGPFAGLEFTKDGQVIVTSTLADLSAAITMRYNVLDGGRISFVQPDGQTIVFQAKVSDDQLGLMNAAMMGPAGFQGYHRLKSGKTLAQAAQAERAEKEQERVAKAKARQAEAVALGEFLGQPKLAIVGTDAKTHLDRMALAVKGANGNWTGVGYVEGDTIVARQIQLTLENPAADGQPFRVVAQFGAVVGPPGTQQLPGGSMTFAVKGEPGHLEIEGSGRSLRPDAATADDLLARYQKTVAEREAIMTRFADRFGSFARLESVDHDPANPARAQHAFSPGLLRVQGKPAFLWTDMSRNDNPSAAAFTQPAEVMLDGETPYLNFGSNLGAFQGVSADGKPALRGKVNGQEVALASVQTLSLDQLKERRASVAAFLDRTLAAGVGLSGVYTENNLPSSPLWPVHFELKNSGQRALSGTCLALPWRTKYAITGKITDTLLGAHLEIQFYKSRNKAVVAPTTGHQTEENGFIVFDLDEAGLPPSKEVSRGIGAGTFKLWALPQAAGLLLVGPFINAGWSPKNAHSGRVSPPSLMSFWAATP